MHFVDLWPFLRTMSAFGSRPGAGVLNLYVSFAFGWWVAEMMPGEGARLATGDLGV